MGFSRFRSGNQVWECVACPRLGMYTFRDLKKVEFLGRENLISGLSLQPDLLSETRNPSNPGPDPIFSGVVLRINLVS